MYYIIKQMIMGTLEVFFGNHGCYKWWSCRLVIHQMGKEMA